MYFTAMPHLPARRALVVALALCMAPVAARAQDVLTEASPQKMAKILTSMGFDVQEAKGSSDDNPAMKFDLGGYQVVLFLANNNTDAQLYVGFGDRKVSTDKVNEWNVKHRFARAYRDKDGDAVLESDIDFTGGVTEANIKAWVKLFRDLMNQYVRFLRD